MKGITFILSILMLSLSLKPCSDGNNSEDHATDEISINHDHQEDSDDSCPIMCICNCCGMSITYERVESITLNTHSEISTLLFSTYQSNYRFDFLSGIWHPPKWIG